jgi:hypothetical protein
MSEREPLAERLNRVWVLLNGEIEMGHVRDPFVRDLVAELRGCVSEAAALERLLAERAAAAADQGGDNVVSLAGRRARPAPGHSPNPNGTPDNHGGAA